MFSLDLLQAEIWNIFSIRNIHYNMVHQQFPQSMRNLEQWEESSSKKKKKGIRNCQDPTSSLREVVPIFYSDIHWFRLWYQNLSKPKENQEPETRKGRRNYIQINLFQKFTNKKFVSTSMDRKIPI